MEFMQVLVKNTSLPASTHPQAIFSQANQHQPQFSEPHFSQSPPHFSQPQRQLSQPQLQFSRSQPESSYQQLQNQTLFTSPQSTNAHNQNLRLHQHTNQRQPQHHPLLTLYHPTYPIIHKGMNRRWPFSDFLFFMYFFSVYFITVPFLYHDTLTFVTDEQCFGINKDYFLPYSNDKFLFWGMLSLIVVFSLVNFCSTAQRSSLKDAWNILVKLKNFSSSPFKWGHRV